LYTTFTGKEIQRQPEYGVAAGAGYPGYPEYPGGSEYPADSEYPASAEYPVGAEYPDDWTSAGNEPYPERTPDYSPVQADSSGGPADLDSWEQWGSPFPELSKSVVPARGALAIDFVLIKSQGGRHSEMSDGDRLSDGMNRPGAGDRFGIAFSATERAYVYIVNIDASGWAQTLFPYPEVPGFNNPVQANRKIRLPNDQLYGLDDARGVETVFVLVSRQPNVDLERALEPLRGKERSASVGTRGMTSRVSVPYVGQRGLLGIVPGASQAQYTTANNQSVRLDRYFTEPRASELAFSRWFAHE
jgi:hypothetical protein